MSANRSEAGYTLGPILGSIAKDIQDLIRGELRLARAELDQKLHRLVIAAVFLLGGALLAFAGLVVVLEGIAAALALVLPVWAASLIVGIVIVAIGGLFALSGLRMISLKALTPTRAADSLQKDVGVLKEHI